MFHINDFLIFYLACGASAGASYFFQHRKTYSRQTLWLKTFLTVFVWIPYALRFLHEIVTRKFPKVFSFNNSSASEKLARNLERIEKDIADVLAAGEAKINVFEFRQAFARYVGLCAACLSVSRDEKPPKDADYFFRLTAHPNPALGAQCMFRRNVYKLRRHQKSAGRELISLLEKCALTDEHERRLRHLTNELFALFADSVELKANEDFFPVGSQTRSMINVTEAENELWKTVSIHQ